MGVRFRPRVVLGRDVLLPSLLALLSALVALAAAEGLLRIKNSAMTNYDIEMWRYARELKTRSDDPLLGHDQRPNASAVLQSVLIRTNAWGLRGGPVAPPDPGRRRILFLGGSITLGWGVSEPDTLTERLARMLAAAGEPTEVLNGGVGNYNAERSVERFFRELRELRPTDIVFHYFLRDADRLDPGGGNLLLRHSQLAVTLWVAVVRRASGLDPDAQAASYRRVYREDGSEFRAMRAALARLADHGRAHGVRLYLAMTPDLRDLRHYRFGFVHDAMRRLAGELGYRYVDLLPTLEGVPASQLWAMPGDPHPGPRGHARMAEALFPVLRAGAGS